jgi:hypothetical protein
MRAILINQTNGGSNSFEEFSRNRSAPRSDQGIEKHMIDGTKPELEPISCRKSKSRR